MNRAREAWKFTDLQTSTTPGKFLLYYYLALFGLPDHEPIWLARTGVVLFSVVGLGAAYALGRQLFSHRAGLLAVVLLAVFPMMAFHERQVLSDPLAATTITMVLWWSVVVAKRPTMPRATILAIFVTLMLAAKVIAVPLVLAPFIAVLIFSPQTLQLRERLWPQIKTLSITYWPYVRRNIIILLVFWTPFMSVYLFRMAFYTDETSPIVVDYIYAGVVDEYEQTTTDVINANVDHLQEMFSILWGLLLIIPTIIGTGYSLVRRPRAAGYILLMIALIWVPLIVLAARPNSRYYMVLGPAWMVLTAGGVMMLYDDLKQSSLGRAAAIVPILSLVGWVALYAIPFNLQMANNATELTYPEKEAAGYFSRYTTYGISDAIDEVTSEPPLDARQDAPVVYIINAFCGSMSYIWPADLSIDHRCPVNSEERGLQPHESFSVDITEILDEYGAFYIVHDSLSSFRTDWLTVPATLERIATYPRPFDGNPVYLYRVVPNDNVVGVGDGQD